MPAVTPTDPAVSDAIAYFTNGLCVPLKHSDAVSYFTLGLVIPRDHRPTGAAGAHGGVIAARRQREEFVKNAKDEAEFLAILIAAVSVIDAED